MDRLTNELIEENMRMIRDSFKTKECLELRITLIRKDYALKSEYDKNEMDLLRIKTEMQIEKLQAIIIQKTHDLIELLKIYSQELEDLDKNKDE
jgi:hypothetical protein